MTQAYVYNGKEVFLTGRTAVKKGRSNKERTLLEVRPIKYLGESKVMPGVEDWVSMRDLYKINSDEENDDE